jgi:hypothetical protein
MYFLLHYKIENPKKYENQLLVKKLPNYEFYLKQEEQSISQ